MPRRRRVVEFVAFWPDVALREAGAVDHQFTADVDGAEAAHPAAGVRVASLVEFARPELCVLVSRACDDVRKVPYPSTPNVDDTIYAEGNLLFSQALKNHNVTPENCARISCPL